MNGILTIILILACMLSVFWEASNGIIRQFSGTQIDILPVIMVYSGLFAGRRTVCLTALSGGLLFDSMSANPLGVNVLSLFLVGWVVSMGKDTLLKEDVFTQCFLGFLAGLANPIISLLILMSAGNIPLLGWESLWQLFIMAVASAAATPLLFLVFDKMRKVFCYQTTTQSSFRSDREIIRKRM
ncbi:MAG: rod shape-determining protein MreD [Verrucomicrobia bacterium]|nr:rod shape-determining protein MreD [Verrucomicrobiota bacterium]MCF7708141.1 rod shape-determining protein MreD [Verrucomicrobiota bacterium]